MGDRYADIDPFTDTSWDGSSSYWLGNTLAYADPGAVLTRPLSVTGATDSRGGGAGDWSTGHCLVIDYTWLDEHDDLVPGSGAGTVGGYCQGSMTSEDYASLWGTLGGHPTMTPPNPASVAKPAGAVAIFLTIYDRGPWQLADGVFAFDSPPTTFDPFHVTPLGAVVAVYYAGVVATAIDTGPIQGARIRFAG